MDDETQSKTTSRRSYERLINAEEVARHIGMSPNWIYYETRKGRIPHIKLGRYYRYRASAINRWLAELEGDPTADARPTGPADEPGTRFDSQARRHPLDVPLTD